MVGGPGTHPPGWVRCHRAPATPDPFRIAAPKGSYSARIVRELCSRIMRARWGRQAGDPAGAASPEASAPSLSSAESLVSAQKSVKRLSARCACRRAACAHRVKAWPQSGIRVKEKSCKVWKTHPSRISIGALRDGGQRGRSGAYVPGQPGADLVAQHEAACGQAQDSPLQHG